jgi:hypothetical protein
VVIQGAPLRTEKWFDKTKPNRTSERAFLKYLPDWSLIRRRAGLAGALYFG